MAPYFDPPELLWHFGQEAPSWERRDRRLGATAPRFSRRSFFLALFEDRPELPETLTNAAD